MFVICNRKRNENDRVMCTVIDTEDGSVEVLEENKVLEFFESNNYPRRFFLNYNIYQFKGVILLSCVSESKNCNIIIINLRTGKIKSTDIACTSMPKFDLKRDKNNNIILKVKMAIIGSRVSLSKELRFDSSMNIIYTGKAMLE